MDNPQQETLGSKATLRETVNAMNGVIHYLREDRRTASLDVDKYARAIQAQNQQNNDSILQFFKMFESLSKEVRDLAVRVEENTKVTLNYETQRDTLTACLVDMRLEQKETKEIVTTLKIAQAVAEEKLTNGKDFSVVGQGWIKWVLGGLITGIIALVVRVVT